MKCARTYVSSAVGYSTSCVEYAGQGIEVILDISNKLALNNLIEVDGFLKGKISIVDFQLP